MCDSELDNKEFMTKKDGQEIIDTSKNIGLFGLYESFTDEEYNNTKCMHYSVIKDIHDNPEILTKEKTFEQKEWHTFGTLVDIMLTHPFEDLERLVVVNDKVPSEQYIKITNYLINNNLLPNKLVSDVVNLSNQQIDEIFVNSGSQVNWKTDTKREKIINECGDYLELLLQQKDKIIVSTDVYNEATALAEVFRNHRWTKELFYDKETQKKKNIEIFYQYKIKYIYSGIQCKSKIDLIVIDHDLQSIKPYDIKTGSDLPKDFLKNIIYKYKGCYQGVLYREGLDKFVESLPAFKDYEVDNFRFVYVSRLKPTYPIILQLDDACHQEVKEFGIETELYSLPALDDLFEEAEYYIDKINSGETNIEPYELQAVWGEKIVTSTKRMLPY